MTINSVTIDLKEFHIPTFKEKAMSKVVSVCASTFNKVCPRGTNKRFIATNIIFPSLCVYAGYKVLQIVGHLFLKSVEETEKHDQLHIDHPTAVGALEGLMGGCAIFLGGVAIGGLLVLGDCCHDRYKNWQKSEQAIIDLEEGIKQSNQEHKAT